jgi:hypothetical protein
MTPITGIELDLESLAFTQLLHDNDDSGRESSAKEAISLC